MRRKEELCQEGEESYHRQLNQEKVNIRRNQRETTFNRKRSNFTPTQHLHRDHMNKQTEAEEKQGNSTNAESNEEATGQSENKYIIIDQRYYDEITKANSNEFTPDSLKELTTLITSKETVEIIYGAIGLRKLLKIVEVGLVDVIIKLTQYQESPQVQLETTWCIANIAAGTHQQCSTLVNKGIIPLLVDIVNKRDYGIIEQAVWAIGNIASDCISFRDKLLEAQAGEAITQLILNDILGDQFKLECCWTLTNLCRGNPLPQFQKVKNPLRILCTMIAMRCILNQEIFIDSCWALSYHYTVTQNRIKDIVDFNLLETIIPIALESDSNDVILPILRIVGQVSVGGSDYTTHLLEKGCLDLLAKGICSEKKGLRRETAWILSNLAASKELQHIQQLLGHDKIMQTMLQLFANDTEDVRKEIAFFFSNMCYGGKELNLDQIFAKIEITVCYLSLVVSENEKVVIDALETLEHILRYAELKKINRGSDVNLMAEELRTNGGLKIIQDLQFNENDEIYYKAHDILVGYYQTIDPMQGKNNFKKNVEQIIKSATKSDQSDVS